MNIRTFTYFEGNFVFCVNVNVNVTNAFGVAENWYRLALFLNVFDKAVGAARYYQINVFRVELEQVVDFLS